MSMHGYISVSSPSLLVIIGILLVDSYPTAALNRPFPAMQLGLFCGVANRMVKFALLLSRYENAGRPPQYLAFFDCFNRQLYFEAHEVLEVLWLQSPGDNYAFYKGLIQLAGAFVHVQKGRKAPALALLRLAEQNLERYPATHEGLDVAAVLRVLCAWRDKVGHWNPSSGHQLLHAGAPQLAVSPGPIQCE